MKKTILIIIAVFFVNTCLAQTTSDTIAYYDALTLARQLDSSKKFSRALLRQDTVKAILKKYLGSNIDNITQFSDSTKNPFLFKFFDPDQTKRLVDAKPIGGLGGAWNSLGGIDVTNLANGIAELMIERAKEELTVAFFNRFKDFAKNNPEFQILFPKTTANLNNLLTYTYPQMLPALRNGFFNDISNITYNLDAVLELPRYQNLLRNFPEVKVAIRSLRLIHELETKSANAADVIREFAAFPEWSIKTTSIEFQNMGNTIRFAAIVSNALRSVDTGKIWISGKDARQLINNDAITRIFIGLIYQQVNIEGIQFFTKSQSIPTPLTTILDSQINNILLFQSKLSDFLALADKVTLSYNGLNYKISHNQKLTDSDVYNYINVSLDAVDYTFSIVKIFDESLVSDQYLTIARKANAIYKDIYGKQYTQAVNDAIDFLTEVHDLTQKDTAPAVNLSGALSKDDALNNFFNFIQAVKPYALFMANMVEARNSDDVKAALENVVLPVGSSSIKKNTKFNVSVQSYLGGYYAFNAPNAVGVVSNKFGVTAPIGISVTPFSFKSWGAVSVFVPLFDLGAIVDYKLKQDSTSTTSGSTNAVTKSYSVKLGQIISPGAYIVYGFGANLPLALGIGGQYGPGLAKIDAGGGQSVSPYWRWSVYLAVDLPLFTLMNVNKTK